jgi:hypothetical protein
VRSFLDKANKHLGKERGEAPDVQSEIILEDDLGNTKVYNSSEKITVNRNGYTIVIRVFEIKENDEIIL